MNVNKTILIRGSTLRVIQTFVGMGIGFWMLPFLITNLGKHDYALWVLVASVVFSYYFLDLGLSHAVTRYVARYIYVEEYERANKIINTSLFIYSILAITVFTATVFAALFIAPTMVEDSHDLKTVQAILLISGLSISFEFPSKAFPGVISAYMRHDTVAIVRTIAQIIRAIAIYFFIGNGFGLVTLAIISFVSNIITTIFFIYYTSTLFKQLSFGRKFISKSDIKELFHFSKWTFISDMTRLYKDKMDIWLIASFISASAVTIYYVAVRLTEYATQLAMQALGITGPIFTKLYAKKEIDKINTTLIFFVKMYLLIFAVFTSGFYTLGESFIYAWVGDEIDYKLAYQCLLILSTGKLFALSTSPFISLLMTIKKHKYEAYLSAFDSIVATLSALYLIPTYGILGAAIAFSAIVAIIRSIVIPLIVINFIDIDIKHLIYRGSIFLLYSLLMTVIINQFIQNASGWLEILYYSPIIATAILGGTIFLFDREERLKVLEWVTHKINKTKESTL